MNTLSQPVVGQEILSYCTKCKMDLAHTIMAMVGGKPNRVICRTCKSEHNYKAKKGVKDPAAPKAARAPRAAKAEKVIPVELEWSKQINASNRPVKNYSTKEGFVLGDRISHPTFGEGVVQKMVYPNKMEVIFRTDIKTLIHSGKAA